MQTGYFWSFYGDRDEVAFTYSVSRSCDVVEPYQKGFEGVLLTDGYPGDESLCKNTGKSPTPKCWTHSRRCFVKSEKTEPEGAPVPLKSDLD